MDCIEESLYCIQMPWLTSLWLTGDRVYTIPTKRTVACREQKQNKKHTCNAAFTFSQKSPNERSQWICYLPWVTIKTDGNSDFPTGILEAPKYTGLEQLTSPLACPYQLTRTLQGTKGLREKAGASATWYQDGVQKLFSKMFTPTHSKKVCQENSTL